MERNARFGTLSTCHTGSTYACSTHQFQYLKALFFLYANFVTGLTLTTSPSQKKCRFHWQWEVMPEI